MSSKKASPSEELLDAIERIADMKQALSLRDRSLTSADGLFVQSGRLPGGSIQYMAGGEFLAKFVFEKRVDGTRIVRKYKPGDWELKVQETLSLCRMLYRASQPVDHWRPRAFSVHRDEAKAIWSEIGAPKWRDLVRLFAAELEKKWPLEYVESGVELPRQVDLKDDRVLRLVAQELERVWDARSPLFAENPLMSLGTLQIAMAYLSGYMLGKGWVSQAEVAEVNVYLGDQLAATIRRLFEGTKSRGIAFASAFSYVSARGAADASAQRSPEWEDG